MPTIALLQANISPNKRENFARYERLLENKIDDTVDLIVFPEMFSCGFSPDVAQQAETEDSESVRFLSRLSQKFNCDTVGSVPIKENNLMYNRLFWLSEGKIINNYDKRLLFIGEEKHFASGIEKTVVNSLNFRFLPLICFEVRFPELSRNRNTDGVFDFDCIVYICNFPAPREREMLILAQARAIENQSFVIVVNRVGIDGNKNHYSGGSAIINPYGKLVAENITSDEEVILHSCDFSEINLIRNSFPVSKFW